MATSKDTPLARVRDFFGMNLKEMKLEFVPLSSEQKRELTDGIVNFYENYSEPSQREKFLSDPKASAEGVLTY